MPPYSPGPAPGHHHPPRHFDVQQTCILQELHTIRVEARDSQWLTLSTFLKQLCLLNIGLEDSRSNLAFGQPKLCNNFIFGMLY